MNLSIPGFPFEIVVTVIRKPQVSRGKLSLTGLLLSVMFLTIFTWCGIRVFDRYAYTTIIQTYYVGDLLPRDSAQVRTELSKFAELLKSSAPHDIWSSRNRCTSLRRVSLRFEFLAGTVMDVEHDHITITDGKDDPMLILSLAVKQFAEFFGEFAAFSRERAA